MTVISRPTEQVFPVAAAIMAAVALLYVLRVTEPFAAPMALGLVTGVVLSPISDFWERLGCPKAVGAMISLILALAVIGVLALVLQPVAVRLIDQMPKVLADVEHTLRDLRRTLQGLDQISEDVAQAMGKSAAEQGADTGEAKVPTVTDALLLAPSILGQAVIYAGTLFFFLATRADIYDWLLKRLPHHGKADRSRLNQLMRAELQVSRYFLTITLINAGVAVATTVALRVIGLPGALQWGLLAFFVNFIVYLGPAVFGVSLLVAGIASFDGAMSLVPAVSFFVINLLEGQFITPSLVGREMRINPLAVFLSVSFGLWLWGAIGGIVAIPLLVWLLVLNQRRGEVVTA